MAALFSPTRPNRFATCLHGRLVSDGRSFPVTVVSLSDDGLVAEGPHLAEAQGPFTVEVAFESGGDSSWNPKASGPQFLHFFSAKAVHSEEPSRPGRLSALFTEIGPTARRLLDDFLDQLSRSHNARGFGAAHHRPFGSPVHLDETAS